jgi:hypothetical protein
LSLPASQARTIRIFSNKPSIVFQSIETAGKLMRLVPASINHISVFIKVDDPQSCMTPTLVNCVDVNSGELVYSWLMLIECI